MKRITAKRFLFAMLAVTVSASFATAQENLLAGAIGTTVNSPEAFYNVWQVFDKDGRPASASSVASRRPGYRKVRKPPFMMMIRTTIYTGIMRRSVTEIISYS